MPHTTETIREYRIDAVAHEIDPVTKKDLPGIVPKNLQGIGTCMSALNTIHEKIVLSEIQADHPSLPFDEADKGRCAEKCAHNCAQCKTKTSEPVAASGQ